MFEPLLADGPAKRVLAAMFGGQYPVLDFLNNDLKARPEDQAKVAALLNRVAQVGPPMNRQKNNKLGDELFELKSKQVRLPYFHMPGNLMVLTHGLIEKQDDLPPEEIARALAVKLNMQSDWEQLKWQYPYARGERP